MFIVCAVHRLPDVIARSLVRNLRLNSLGKKPGFVQEKSLPFLAIGPYDKAESFLRGVSSTWER
jgi:hypothetical protein